MNTFYTSFFVVYVGAKLTCMHLSEFKFRLHNPISMGVREGGGDIFHNIKCDFFKQRKGNQIKKNNKKK